MTTAQPHKHTSLSRESRPTGAFPARPAPSPRGGERIAGTSHSSHTQPVRTSQPHTHSHTHTHTHTCPHCLQTFADFLVNDKNGDSDFFSDEMYTAVKPLLRGVCVCGVCVSVCMCVCVGCVCVCGEVAICHSELVDKGKEWGILWLGSRSVN